MIQDMPSALQSLRAQIARRSAARLQGPAEAEAGSVSGVAVLAIPPLGCFKRMQALTAIPFGKEHRPPLQTRMPPPVLARRASEAGEGGRARALYFLLVCGPWLPS